MNEKVANQKSNLKTLQAKVKSNSKKNDNKAMEPEEANARVNSFYRAAFDEVKVERARIEMIRFSIV